MSIDIKNTEIIPPHYGHVYAALIYEDKSDPVNPIVRVFDLKPYLDKHFADLTAQIDELKKLLGA